MWAQVARVSAEGVQLHWVKVRYRRERRGWADLVGAAPAAVSAAIGNIFADVLATEAPRRLRLPDIVAAEVQAGDRLNVSILRRFVAIEAAKLRHYGG